MIYMYNKRNIHHQDTPSSEGANKLPFSIGNCISSGDFGIFYFAGKFLETNKAVDVIRIQLANVERIKIIELFKTDVIEKVNEADQDCQFILRYLDIQLDDPFLYLTTDAKKCDNANESYETLKDLIDRELSGANEIIVGHEKSILRQVTRGLNYLHSKGIIHRDLKPSNILICKTPKKEDTPRVKLANFAICGTLIKTAANKKPIGSPGWISPESFKTGVTITSKFDIFSLGLVFGYTLTVGGKHLFGKTPLDQTVAIQERLSDKINLEKSDLKSSYWDQSKLIIELIELMCKTSPEQRPTTEKVLNNAFLKEEEGEEAEGTQEHKTALPSSVTSPQGPSSSEESIRKPPRVRKLEPKAKKFKKLTKTQKGNPSAVPRKRAGGNQKKNPDREKKTHGPGFSYKT